MKARILLLLAMILVLFGGSSAPLAADDAVVPFKARYQTYPVEVSFDSVTGIITYDIPGDGWAAHLGNSTFASDSWVNFYQGPPHPQLTTGEFTAANGDQLYVSMQGTAIVGQGQGTFQITGGSGHFEGVTGSGVYWFWLDFDVLECYCHFDGTLTK